MENEVRIVPGGLDDSRVVALLDHHVTVCRAETGHGGAHALDLAGLQAPNIRFWSGWAGDRLLVVGALKTLSPDEGEVKSMHTVEAARRSGAGAAMLRHIIAAARDAGLARLSLETGSWDFFRPAHAFYRAHGFVECAPFGSYKPDPNSLFFTMDLNVPA